MTPKEGLAETSGARADKPDPDAISQHGLDSGLAAGRNSADEAAHRPCPSASDCTSDPATADPDMLAAALWYAKNGIPVFPLHHPIAEGCSCGKNPGAVPDSEVCNRSIGKHPRTDNGFKSATTDVNQIAKWWGKYPDANIGIPTGAVTNILVIDSDPRNGGPTDRSELIKIIGPIPETAEAVTGGDGRHVYLHYSGGPVPKELAQGIDLKGDGGYVVAPPSLHKSGKRYQWDGIAGAKAILHPAEAPGWLLEFIAGKRADVDPRAAMELPQTILDGQKHAAIVSLAGTLRKRGCTEKVAFTACRALEFESPVSDEDIRERVRSVYRLYPAGADGGGDEPRLRERIEAAYDYADEHGDSKEELSKFDYTDYGNERAFETLFGDDFRFNWTTKQWLKWNDVYWEPDTANSIDRRVLDVAQARLGATTLLPEMDGSGNLIRNKAISAARKLRNVRNRQSAIQSATSNERFARRSGDFDQDDYLFACTNGVFDLKNGIFRPGRREDMITKAFGAKYNLNAACERWKRFLDEIFDNKREMVDFIQRAVGYSLLGLTREEVFFILHGGGRNGKGTFLRVLLALFGDLGLNTEFSTLIADRNSSKAPRNDIAAMAGRRFVCAQESKEGTQFDESLIKTLTGGDMVTARFLYKELFTFRPTWKIWLATNHKPVIRGSDAGIWSRPKLIPFNVSFVGREDLGLKGALLDPQELSGVLNWAIEGCQLYLKDGLQYPQEVKDATAQYKTESDYIARFIEECCVIIPTASVRARALYQSFAKWACDTGETGITETAFGLRMKEHGYEKQRDAVGNKYSGIGFRASCPAENCDGD